MHRPTLSRHHALPIYPTELDQQTFAQAVVDAMQGHNPGQPTHLTLTPGDSARSLYRVVVAFDPTVPVSVFELCRGPIETRPATDKIQVRAALCEGRGTLTSVRGETVAGTRVEDGRFQALMASIARQPMPRYTPQAPHRDDRAHSPFPHASSYYHDNTPAP